MSFSSRVKTDQHPASVGAFVSAYEGMLGPALCSVLAPQPGVSQVRACATARPASPGMACTVQQLCVNTPQVLSVLTGVGVTTGPYKIKSHA